jgi:hypothetical protein
MHINIPVYILVLGLFPFGQASADDDNIEELETMEEVVPSEGFFGEQVPAVERSANLFYSRPTRQNSLLIVIDHRTNKPLLDSQTGDYLGLDAGALKIGLGLRYGIYNNLDLGFYRLNGTAEIFDTYEFDARFQFLEQEKYLINASLRGGLTWFLQPDQEDKVGFFAQLLVDHVFFERLLIGSGLLFHSESSNDTKSLTDKAYSVAIQTMAELRFASFLAATLEMAANLSGYGEKWPIFAMSIKALTHRHSFSLVLSNNQYMSADGIVANTWRGFDDLVIGFQITREINF